MNAIFLPDNIARSVTSLLRSSPLENGGVLFCRAVYSDGFTRLLGVEFSPYEECEIQRADEGNLVIAAQAVNQRLQHAATNRFSLIQVHTHPCDDDAVFSSTDDLGEKEMLPVIFRRVGAGPHGCLVVARTGMTARIYDSPARHDAARILRMGSTITRLDRSDGVVENQYDRTVRAIGHEGQLALRRLRVAVVGLGGTGSVVSQQLAYLGVNDAVLVDHDAVQESNLNRLVGATFDDIGYSKVSVAQRQYQRVNRHASVHGIEGDIVDEIVARRLLDRDLVFCCTDNQFSRSVLNWMSYQFFVPFIDMGVEIVVNEKIADICGRVQFVAPGSPCLHCCGAINADRVRAEMMSEEQRAADEYVTGVVIPQPAVITFNGVIASLATTMLLGVVTEAPLQARIQSFNALTGQVRSAVGRAQADCPVCDEAGPVYGRGEEVVPIWRPKDLA